MIFSSLLPGLPTEFGKQIFNCFPNTTTSMATLGGVVTIAATASTPAPAATNAITRRMRTLFTNAAAAASGYFKAVACAHRSSTVGYGGFYFYQRFSVSGSNIAGGFFSGLGPNAALAGSTVTNNLTNCIGLAYDAADATNANYKIYAAGATANNSPIATTVNRTTNQNSILELYLFCPPSPSGSGGDIYYTLVCDGVVNVDGVILASDSRAIALDTMVTPRQHVFSASACTNEVYECYLETY